MTKSVIISYSLNWNGLYIGLLSVTVIKYCSSFHGRKLCVTNPDHRILLREAKTGTKAEQELGGKK